MPAVLIVLSLLGIVFSRVFVLKQGRLLCHTSHGEITADNLGRQLT